MLDCVGAQTVVLPVRGCRERLLVCPLVVGAVGSCLVPVLASNLGPSLTLRTVVAVRLGSEVERLIGSEVELVGDIVCGVSLFVLSDFSFLGTWCLLSV